MFVAALGHSQIPQRYIFMRLCYYRDFLRRVWEAPLSGSLVLVCGFIWLRNSVCHVAPGKIQMAKGFKWVVGHAFREGDSLAHVWVSSCFLFLSTLLNGQLCLILVGGALALDRARVQGHCGPHSRSARSIFFCLLFCAFLPVLEPLFFSVYLFGHVNLWIFMLIQLIRNRLEWCIEEISITYLPLKGIFIVLKWSWTNLNFSSSCLAWWCRGQL